jgi:hypothetical protein
VLASHLLLKLVRVLKGGVPMLPEPLHPAIVHLPMALAALAPAGVLLAMLALWSGSLPIRAWVAVVLVQLALAGT